MIRCRKLQAVSLACLVLLTAACQGSDGAAPNKPKERQAHNVEVGQVKHMATGAQWTLTGTLEARRIARIFNEEEGRLVELPFYESDAVATGTVVARLDDALIRAELDKAEANRRQAELDLKRLEQLAPRKLASEDEMARARTVVEVARAEETLLRTRAARTVIRAPFAGVVTTRLAEPGDVLQRNSHVLTVIDPTDLRVALPVSELQLVQVKPGDAVEVRIDALGRKGHLAKVLRVHPQIDPITRQGLIEVSLNPAPAGARPGQLCRVTLTAAPSERLVAPLAAVQHDAEGPFVFVVAADGKVRRTRVHTGEHVGDHIEILDGLAPDMRVVVRGFLELRDGSKVRVADAGREG